MSLSTEQSALVDLETRKRRFLNEIQPVVNTLLRSFQREQTSQERKVRQVMKNIQEISRDNFSPKRRKAGPKQQPVVVKQAIGGPKEKKKEENQPKNPEVNLNDISDRRKKLMEQKRKALMIMSSQEGPQMYQGLLNSVECSSYTPVQQDYPDTERKAQNESNMRSRVVKTSNYFYRRTGLRKDHHFKKYLLPYIEESKILAQDQKIEEQFQDLELMEFRSKFREKVERYLRFLDQEAEKRKAKYKIIRSQKLELPKHGKLKGKIDQPYSYNVSPSQSAYYQSSFDGFNQDIQRFKVTQTKLSHYSPPMNSSSQDIDRRHQRNRGHQDPAFEEFIRDVQSRRSPTPQSHTQIQAFSIMNQCDRTSRKLTSLSKRFKQSQVKNDFDFERLWKQVEHSESQTFMEKQMICFD